MSPPNRPHRPQELSWKENSFKELVRLAWPITVSMLSYSMMTTVDTLFVGRLGVSALAGVSLGGIYAFTLICFGMGLLRAVKVVVSQAVGAGKAERVPHMLSAGVFIALGLGAVTVLVGAGLTPVLRSIAATAASGDAATEYGFVRLLGSPLFLLGVALREASYGEGNARAPMRAALVANAANFGLDYLFIFGLGWGVFGAAIASVAAQSVEALALLWVMRRHLWGLRHVRFSAVLNIWRMGYPMGLQMLLEVGSFAVLAAMFAAMGEREAGAHQIAIQICHLSFLPAFALGEAASVMVGQAVGADRDGIVRRVAFQTVGVTTSYTTLCGVGFAAAAYPLASLFTDDPLLQQTTAHLLYVAAAFQLFDGAHIAGRSVLRGTGDVKYPAVVCIAAAWLLTPPLALILGFWMGLGALGGWVGLCLEIIASAVLLWHRFLSGGWLKAAKRSREALSRDEAESPALVPAET